MTTDTVACFSPLPLSPLDPCASDPMACREALESSLLSERLFRLRDAALEAGVAPARNAVEFTPTTGKAKTEPTKDNLQ